MSKVRKCPDCEEQMEKGYIVLSSGMRWKHKGSRFWQIRELLFYGNLLEYVKKEAHRCSSCRLALFRYERKVSSH